MFRNNISVPTKNHICYITYQLSLIINYQFQSLTSIKIMNKFDQLNTKKLFCFTKGLTFLYKEDLEIMASNLKKVSIYLKIKNI